MLSRERNSEIETFLTAAGWAEARRAPLAGDASTRRYERLVAPGGRQAVLMDAPPAAETPGCPPAASPRERRRLGYNAMACLAGPNVGQFVGVDLFLRDLGLSAPEILSMDLSAGFLLLEDLGDDLFVNILGGAISEQTIYTAALDVLLAVHRTPPPAELPVPGQKSVPLHSYDLTAYSAEAELLTEWFAPAAGCRLSESDRNDYRSLWAESLGRLALDSDPVLVLRDYHAQNLLWVGGREGPARVGLLDFQDALRGSRAYDLVSLLQDARRDVARSLEQAMLDCYCAGAGRTDPAFDEAAFRSEYAYWGVQRNAKIVGIFARLARRDHKPAYLQHLPRVWRHMERGLSHPALSELKAWFDALVPPDRRGIPEGLA